MVNLFLSVSADIFNDVSQPWQLGFQVDASTIFVFYYYVYYLVLLLLVVMKLMQ